MIYFEDISDEELWIPEYERWPLMINKSDTKLKFDNLAGTKCLLIINSKIKISITKSTIIKKFIICNSEITTDNFDRFINYYKIKGCKVFNEKLFNKRRFYSFIQK